MTETAGERMLDLREWVGLFVTSLVDEGEREGLVVACCSWDGGSLTQALVFAEGFWVATEKGLLIDKLIE